jgi:hypothetical protein
MSGAGLRLTKPPLRSYVLKERVQPIGPFVLAPGDGETTANIFSPAFGVGKAGPARDTLLDCPGVLALEGDLCYPDI